MTSDSSSRSVELAQPTRWYKPLIWAVFIALLYLLREFFLIGFLTFLFCFVVRSAVGLLMRRLSPDRDDHRLDLILTLSFFLGICLLMYGLGRFLVPQIIRQGKSLATQIKESSADGVQNTFLANTVGKWKFDHQFGQSDDPRYQKGLSQFQAAGRNGQGLYQEFPKLRSRLQAEFEAVVARVHEGLGHLFRIPIQVVTALLLAVFMLIEWDGVKTGVSDLRNTRVQPIYDEIAPGVIALSKLIGKSFQGQVIIAFFNACFTLVALWMIGVEYKFILALVVFVFSFIPVVGVILSGLPICMIAVLQPGGSLFMAVQVMVVIAIIHLIEGMILSPRIIGKIGHLHPVLVIAILLVGEKFFGMWGLVLGVPVAIYVIRVVILDSPIPGIYQPGGCGESGAAEAEVTHPT